MKGSIILCEKISSTSYHQTRKVNVVRLIEVGVGLRNYCLPLFVVSVVVAFVVVIVAEVEVEVAVVVVIVVVTVY